MNKYIIEDATKLIKKYKILLDQLSGSNVLITGATGLIGQNVVITLSEYNKTYGGNISIFLLVRSENSAKMLFENTLGVRYIVGDILDIINIKDKIDYVIHAASITSSKEFVNKPVDVIRTSIIGTDNILRFACEKQVKKLIYLSSIEVYGAPQNEEKISENVSWANINTMSVRSCYPESKRMCENLCVSYGKQYGLNGSILRLTQTFGPGVKSFDSRVFAEFMRCAITGENIVLHTDGLTKRSYLYTSDAVAAILFVLVLNDVFDVYNVANEDSYCTIKELAQNICELCTENTIEVNIQLDNNGNRGYAPKLKMNLDTSKIRSLGWTPEYGLKDMLQRLYVSMKESIT